MRKHLQQLASSRRLLILLGISLLLHGMLFINWPTAKLVLEFDDQLQNLSINLEPIEVISQQQAQQQKLAQPQSQTNNVRPAPHKPTPTRQTPAAQQDTQESSIASQTMQTQPQTVSKATSASMNRARILSQIRHDLSQYFYYPPLARRQGLQGTVLLAFGVSGQGNIHDIRIVKSSGYAILDLAAQDAMQRLDKLSWYAALMHGKNMDLELPVIFRLTEG